MIERKYNYNKDEYQKLKFFWYNKSFMGIFLTRNNSKLCKKKYKMKKGKKKKKEEGELFPSPTTRMMGIGLQQKCPL